MKKITYDFTPIPHDVVEKLMRTDLSPYESRILMVIFRMTYGYEQHRLTGDYIANKTFRERTGIKDRGNVHRTVHGLAARRIIVVSRDYKKAAHYQINRDLAEWIVESPKTTSRKKRAPTLPVVSQDYVRESPETTGMESPETTQMEFWETPSKETEKEKEKRDKEITALRAASLSNSDHPIKDTDRTEEVRKQKELSKYRNKMFKSGLYSSDELASFLGKPIEELMKIDDERFEQDFRKKTASS